MGVLDLRTVNSWRVRVERTRDDGEPVGRRECGPAEHTATLSSVGGDGRVVYGAELSVAVFASEVRELPPAVTERLGLTRMHAWLFMADLGLDLTKYTVSFAALPYSQGRVFSAPLRPPKHRRADVINRALVAAIEKAEATDPEWRLQEALDGLSFVPFQHQPRTVAAWMIYPTSHPLLGVGRFNQDRDYTLGICRELERCMALLRIDPLIERLLEQTRTGELFDTLPSPKQNKKGPIARPVSDEAKASSEQAMDLAIRMALAGVVDGQRLYGRNSADEPRYVAMQVEPIYREIIYKWSRDGPQATARKRIESLRESLRRRGDAAVIAQFTRQVKDWDPADKAALHLILAYPDEWRRLPELEDFLRRAWHHLSPDSLEYALIRDRLRTRRSA